MTLIDMGRLLVLAAAALALLTGCNASMADSARLSLLDPETTQIQYRFNDASVPPEYHRSYTLTASAAEARIVVDAYGDVLHDEIATVDDDTWRAVLRAAAGLPTDSSGHSDDCAGGTSRDLLITEADERVLDVQVADCGSDGQGQAEVIEAFVTPLLELFDTERLLAPSP